MSTALAVLPRPAFSREQIDLIKGTIAKGASDQELALFLAQCERTGLDPFSRQIYWISRGGRGSTQVSIDGFRVIAERTNEMDGQDVAWCGEDGLWKDVWLDTKAPMAARVLVYRKGCAHPFPGIALWAEYAQSSQMWQKMKANQLAKCAESLALRKAFPHQLSGLYTTDEMAQAGSEPDPTTRVVAVTLPETPRVELPEGAHRVLTCDANGDKPWRATMVAATGEEIAVTIFGEAVRTLAVECAQDGAPVVAKINRSNQLTSLKRHATVVNNAIDAEIAAKEAAKEAEVL